MGDTNKTEGRSPSILYWTVIFVGAALAAYTLTYFLFVKVRPGHLQTVSTVAWWGASVDAKGVATPLAGRYLIQFWTPSVHTKEAKQHQPWEVVNSDRKLDDFGDLLKADKRVYGYRRYEVIGAGVAGRRHGYWWALTVGTDYTPADLMKVYRAFWQNEGSIYIEVISEDAERLR